MTLTATTLFDKVAYAAYETAWREFAQMRDLTPDERISGPHKLRSYIQLMMGAGERNPAKIAKSALGMMRQDEQISRSKARLAMNSVSAG